MRAASRRVVSYLLPFAASLALGVTGCARIFVPNPPPSTVETPAPPSTREPAPAVTPVPLPPPAEETPTSQAQAETPTSEPEAPTPETVDTAVAPVIDFAAAFEEETIEADEPFIPPVVVIDTSAPQPSLRYPPYKLRKRDVRVMIRGGVKQATVSTSGRATVRTAGGGGAGFKGRMQIESLGGATIVATVDGERRELRLPCTVLVNSGDGLLRLGDERYRGAFVIVPDQAGAMTIINVLNVEDYLRGVVPLEIGNLREPDIEAVKAQAVAARTYTYQRMAMRAANEFDLVNTVSDQVYGGANAEGQVPDMAIRLTKDLIMVYDENLVNAYYHSTCGGVTANVEDVWGAEAQPYLRSVSDTRPDGSAYCGASNGFSWTERWSVSQMTNIIRRFAADGRVQPPLRGTVLRRLIVLENFECGRVKTLLVSTNAGDHTAGGDRIRFLLRRNTSSNPILRSSLITNLTMTETDITISGRGHGHGVGMCQVGAIHRARDGQQFERILGSYYSGVSIRTATN